MARDHAFCSSGSQSTEKSFGMSSTQSWPFNLFSSKKAQSTGTKPHFLARSFLHSVLNCFLLDIGDDVFRLQTAN